MRTTDEERDRTERRGRDEEVAFGVTEMRGGTKGGQADTEARKGEEDDNRTGVMRGSGEDGEGRWMRGRNELVRSRRVWRMV